jgi:WD40 repeat protein
MTLVFSSAVAAQTAPPATDIFLAGIETDPNGIRITSQPRNVTDRAAYDNQPFFLPDGKSFFYTCHQDNGQMDTCRYDVANQSTKKVTQTPEGEYSPTPMPDGKHFSVIRVESDGTQRLWKFTMEGTEPTLILENVKPVGYQAWGDGSTVAMFILGDPPTLQVADTQSNKVEKIAENIGRSLHKIPGQRAISFVHKTTDDEWWIKRLDLASRKASPIVRTLPSSEDYAWTPDGTLIMGKDGKLYKYTPDRDQDWLEVVELTGVKGITRIAVSPKGDQLALVGTRAEN